MMHTVNAVAAAVPFLEKSSSGSIVLISSVSGFEVDFAAGSYGAFKAALIHYAKGLSRQLVGKGIRVNCVSPGNTYFDGGIWQTIEKDMPDLFDSTLKVNPTGKFGTAAEVANGVVFLSSPVASRISGTNLVIDGALPWRCRHAKEISRSTLAALLALPFDALFESRDVVRDQHDDFGSSLYDLPRFEAGGSQVPEKRLGKQLRDARRRHRAIGKTCNNVLTFPGQRHLRDLRAEHRLQPLDLDRLSDQRRHDLRKPQIRFVKGCKGSRLDRFITPMTCFPTAIGVQMKLAPTLLRCLASGANSDARMSAMSSGAHRSSTRPAIDSPDRGASFQAEGGSASVEHQSFRRGGSSPPSESIMIEHVAASVTEAARSDSSRR